MNHKQQIFIMRYAATGDKIASYKQAYNSKSENQHAIDSAANRLLRKPEIREALLLMKREQFSRAEEQLQKDLQSELLDLQEKRSILAEVATASERVGQGTIYTRLRAIDIDNRIMGLYGNPSISFDTFLHNIYSRIDERKQRSAGHALYTNAP
jgi:hypothetical protein